MTIEASIQSSLPCCLFVDRIIRSITRANLSISNQGSKNFTIVIFLPACALFVLLALVQHRFHQSPGLSH